MEFKARRPKKKKTTEAPEAPQAKKMPETYESKGRHHEKNLKCTAHKIVVLLRLEFIFHWVDTSGSKSPIYTECYM